MSNNDSNDETVKTGRLDKKLQMQSAQNPNNGTYASIKPQQACPDASRGRMQSNTADGLFAKL